MDRIANIQRRRDNLGPAPQGLTSEPVDPMSMQEQPSADVVRFGRATSLLRRKVGPKEPCLD